MKPVATPACLLTALMLCLFCPSARIWAQESADAGSISGVVIDNWYRRGLGGVIVTVRGTTLAATTDGNGQYRLEQIPAGEHIVVFSKSGYARSIVTNVRVVAGQITRVDNHLRPEFYEMEEYVVDAPQLEQEMADLLGSRQGDLKVMDVLGKDFLSRAGAGDAGEAAAKIVGVTIEDGKFLVVRGLAERYSNTLLNGARVPSADPDKKAVQMDVIPSDAIERIETSKTFTPDQPGDFSGGTVNVVTRRYPQEFFWNVSIGTAYNTEATFNDEFLTYDGGSTDWAGFDDGTRDIPSDWSRHDQERISDLQAIANNRSLPLVERQAAADEVIRLTSVFDEQLTPFEDAPPPDLSFATSLGNRFDVFDKPFGYYVGVNYERKYRHQGDAFLGRYNASGASDVQIDEAKDEVRSTESVNWGSLVNLAYEFLEGHELAFVFLYNRNSEDESIVRQGFDFDRRDDWFEQYILHYTEREMKTFQLHGTHAFPEFLDMKTEWTAALSNTSQDEPDYRVFEFVRSATGVPSIPTSSVLEPTRFFRAVEEDNVNLKLDQTVPFDHWTAPDGKVKFGVFYSGTDRTYDDRRFAYNSNVSPRFGNFQRNRDPDTFLHPTNMTYQSTAFGIRWDKFIFEKPFTHYDGTHDINAGYAMLELPILDRLKVVGGARYEISDLMIVATGERPGEAEINEKNLLPSASLIYEVVTNMNVRLAFGRTLARPTFREIGPAYFDFANNEILVGNPDLEQTDIDNYDVRWEWFRRPGEVLAASLFYKELTNPIEKTIITRNNQVQYQNRDEATLYGFELEARAQLDFIDPHLEYFNVGVNFAWIESETTASDFEYDNAIRGKEERSLQGQSPYVVNADITFSNPKIGTTVSLFYNVFGERISEVSAVAPNVYEQPVHSLDFSISQKLWDHVTLKFAAKNLLDPTYKKTIDFAGEELIYSSYRKGRTFSLSLSYEF